MRQRQRSVTPRDTEWLLTMAALVCCYPFDKLRQLIFSLMIIGVAPFTAFAHMLSRVYDEDPITGSDITKQNQLHVFRNMIPQMMWMMWTLFCFLQPFLLMFYIIPHIIELNVLYVKLYMIWGLSVFLLVSTFVPVLITLRAGLEWKIIDTRYRYFGKMNFHLVQKVQQLLGPVSSIAELNWLSPFELTTLIEDIHVSVYHDGVRRHRLDSHPSNNAIPTTNTDFDFVNISSGADRHVAQTHSRSSSPFQPRRVVSTSPSNHYARVSPTPNPTTSSTTTTSTTTPPPVPTHTLPTSILTRNATLSVILSDGMSTSATTLVSPHDHNKSDMASETPATAPDAIGGESEEGGGEDEGDGDGEGEGVDGGQSGVNQGSTHATGDDDYVDEPVFEEREVGDVYGAILQRTDIDDATRNQLCRLIAEMRSHDPYVQRHATSLKVRWTTANVLAVCHVILEFLQFSGLSTYTTAGQPWVIDAIGNSFGKEILVAPIVNAFGVSILTFDSQRLNIITFWLVVGVVFMWLWLTRELHWANVSEIICPGEKLKKRLDRNATIRRLASRRDQGSGSEDDEADDDDDDDEEGEHDDDHRSSGDERGDEWDSDDERDEKWLRTQQTWYNAAKKVTRTKMHRLVLYLVSDMWFWGIVIKLSGFLACDYTTSSQPYMKQVPTEMCLRGHNGITYGLTASFGLMYYVFTSFCYTNMQCEVRSEVVKDFDIQFDHQFTGLERLIKLAGALTMSLLGSLPYVPQATAAMCAFAMLLLLSRRASCTVFAIDFWRPTFLWIVVFSSLVSVVVITTDTGGKSFGLWALFLATVLVLIQSLLKWFLITDHIKVQRRRVELPTSNPLLDNLLSST